ncbi:AarF domain-containing kinase [Trichophyton interdigitale]|nr:AarF domain-containing kinase [Trichophyton interdigitale]KAG5216888.1 AarF domain-containing kinase [Trichophyton interdigitale]KAG8210577.1 AarF domain-containing kinase [Trichophyton interdigitale]
MSARIATRFLTPKPTLGRFPPSVIQAWSCQQCLRWDNNRSVGRLLLDNTRLYHGTSLRYGQETGGTQEGPSRVNGRKRSRRGFVLAAATGTLGGTLLFFYDDVKHAYRAAERTGRVVAALLVCINDYRVTLNKETGTEEERTTLLNACHQRCADRTLKVLEKNGSIFIKLGQHLSSLGYLLPLEWTTTFIPLQDKCPVSSFESVQEMFLRDTGHTIDEIFSSFDPMPIGAASLAQVHVAVLRETGQKVAVKVQHPTLQEWAPLDLSLTRFTFSSLKRVFPEYDLEWLAREMDFSLPQELDFQMEAENARVAREYFSKRTNAPLIIPKVIWAKKRLLVMEFISGHRPDDLEFLDSNNIDRDEVSASLAHIFNEMIFGDGAPLHCDPHGGNIAICKNDTRKRGPNFDIVLYDHGLYRTIPKEMRINYAKLWLAVINADEKEMRKYAYEVAGVTDQEFPLFASAITGRDYTVLAQNQVASSRSSEEKESITTALGDGMLQELVSLLGKVPRIMLLILKTNDLTRNLDENLHTRHGPVRTFLILAKYATCAVFSQEMELISQQGSIFWPPNFLRFLQAWVSYLRVEIKLEIYEHWLSLRNRLGLTNH